MRVRSPEITKGISVAELIDQLSATAFNARRLAEAARICAEMMQECDHVFLTLAGAMIPAGMRNIVAGMIAKRYVNTLVTTGANIVHELVEALGYGHTIGSANVDDVRLAEENVNRIYDVFVDNRAFEAVESFLSGILSELEGNFGSYEFLREVGRRLEAESFIRDAYEKDAAIVCPTLHDSIAGLHVSIYARRMRIDYVRDIKYLLDACFEAKRAGVIIIGGGVPKNFTLQAMLLADGFDYAVQITTDAPHFGGLSGATLEEAKSWCKLKANAKTVTVYCDATIALPMIYAYILEKLD